MPVTAFHILYLLLTGLFVGFTGALFGVGGGFILVPLLTFLFGADAHHAIGTSLAVIMFTGSSSAFSYFSQRRIDWRLALLTEASTMPGGLTGAFLTTYFSSKELKTLLAALLVALAITMLLRGENRNTPTLSKCAGKGRFLWKRRIVDSSGDIFEYSVNVLKLMTVGFAAGIASGFFGIGGGVIKVPALYHLNVPIHVTIATSTLMITLTAFSGTLGHAALGHILWSELLGIVPGSLLGTQLGARTAHRARSRTLKRAFSLVLAGMAILLLLK